MVSEHRFPTSDFKNSVLDSLALSKSTIYASNLDFSLTNSDLHTLFSSFGKIAQVTGFKDRLTRFSSGVAFILFVSRDAAKFLLFCRGPNQFPPSIAYLFHLLAAIPMAPKVGKKSMATPVEPPVLSMHNNGISFLPIRRKSPYRRIPYLPICRRIPIRRRIPFIPIRCPQKEPDHISHSKDLIPSLAAQSAAGKPLTEAGLLLLFSHSLLSITPPPPPFPPLPSPHPIEAECRFGEASIQKQGLSQFLQSSQHELGCTSSALKVKTQELEEQKNLNKQIMPMQNITDLEGRIKPVETAA